MLQPTQEQSSYGLSKVKFSWLVALQSQAAVASNSLYSLRSQQQAIALFLMLPGWPILACNSPLCAAT